MKMNEKDKIVRYYSLNQENLDRTLKAQFEFFMECASDELKEEARTKLGVPRLLSLSAEQLREAIEEIIENSRFTYEVGNPPIAVGGISVENATAGITTLFAAGEQEA
ncbi:unnamed protein product, partial [marine sediment metagenome]